MHTPVFRFAPSPNGHLHLGHAYSALFSQAEARRTGGRFLLRIEDIDHTRCKLEFEQQIYRDLAWLGLAWETPVRRQSEHLDSYAKALAVLQDKGLVYPCFCSRRQIAQRAGPEAPRDPDGALIYPGTCRDLPAGVRAEKQAAGDAFALRIHMTKAMGTLTAPLSFSDVASGSHTVTPGIWGDVIIARKIIHTSYHLAVCVDDAAQHISHVTRGMDLFAATHIHRLLQHLLGLPEPVYHHHRLISDAEGLKFSKSAQSQSLKSLRKEGVSAREIIASFKDGLSLQPQQ